MKYHAVLRTMSNDAGSVSSALEVDNVKQKDLEIKTRKEKNFVVTEIWSNSLATLANTLDDVVSCQMAAERSLDKK